MRTKVTYMLVTLVAVAAANPLPQDRPTSVAAHEDNATCNPLLLTDESQCAVAIGVGPNDVEESSSLEKRVSMRDALGQFNKHLMEIKKSCNQLFLNLCSPDNQSKKNLRSPHEMLNLFNNYEHFLLEKPVPRTDIKIKRNPRVFIISFVGDVDNQNAWLTKLSGMSKEPFWEFTGYNLFEFWEDSGKMFVTCSPTVHPGCFFHISARILTRLGMSIKKDDDAGGLWNFQVPSTKIPEAPQNRVDGAPDDDGTSAMPSNQTNPIAPAYFGYVPSNRPIGARPAKVSSFG